MKRIITLGWVLLLAISLNSFSSCTGPARITTGVAYYQPPWAPPYYNGVRYYYFPDIEVYYDLDGEVFVYLSNGQWIFAPVLPPYYTDFDLYTGFIITLNLNVYQPWLHHQYYVAHYPRYYYRNTYANEWNGIRGFNENLRKPFYWNPGEKDRAHELRKNPPPPRAPKVKPSPQETNYGGKPVGRPVKVKPVMKQVKENIKQRNTPAPRSSSGNKTPKKRG